MAVYQTTEPIVIDGYTFIPKGTTFTRRVLWVQPFSKQQCHNGILELTGPHLTWPDGQKLISSMTKEFPYDPQGKLLDKYKEHNSGKSHKIGEKTSEAVAVTLQIATLPIALAIAPIVVSAEKISGHSASSKVVGASYQKNCKSDKFEGQDFTVSAGTNFYLVLESESHYMKRINSPDAP
ncbi:MAG: hypothetical protein P4L10_02945 [Acidobacteriaceae bacterium]|nr:hypothetical protein [Acidobacteriaceae bacterium]